MKLNKFTAFAASLSVASLLILSSNVNAGIERVYKLKGDAMPGTKILRVDAVSPISFNKRFANLSDREQAIFRGKYNELSAYDTPPFPRMGLRTIYRPIVNANKTIAANGSLHLSATVNANGFVESVEVINSPDVKLTAIAEKTLLRTKFDPASCNGTACEMTFPLEITFE